MPDVIHGHLELLRGIYRMENADMLKRDESDVNSLSAVSCKTANQRYRRVNVMIAYNVRRMKQVVSYVYLDNIIDMRIVSDFVDVLGIQKSS